MIEIFHKILIIDALAPLKQHDSNIASHVVNEGRSIVIVVNKWDLVEESEKEAFEEEFYYQSRMHQNNNLSASASRFEEHLEKPKI